MILFLPRLGLTLSQGKLMPSNRDTYNFLQIRSSIMRIPVRGMVHQYEEDMDFFILSSYSPEIRFNVHTFSKF